MLNEYRRTKTTVSFIHYHFVFCPRYRRKIFLNSQVEERFKTLVQEICDELEIEVLAMECDQDHVHLFLNTLPTFSPTDIMAKIKGVTSKKLERNFLSSTFAKSMDTFLFCFNCWKRIKRND